MCKSNICLYVAEPFYYEIGCLDMAGLLQDCQFDYVCNKRHNFRRSDVFSHKYTQTGVLFNSYVTVYVCCEVHSIALPC